MWVWVDRLGALVLDATLSAAVLLFLVALAMLGCRQPARRIWLARAGIVGSLALIPLVGLAPLPRFDLVRVLRRPEIQAHPLLGSGGETVPRATAPGAGPQLPDVRWPTRAFTMLYLVGLSGSLAALMLGCWGVRWLLRRSGAPSPATLALYHSLPLERAGARPRLRVTDRVRRPVLVGAVRPTILIPADLDRPEATAALRLSLLHELAHAENADPWFRLAGGLAQAFWFCLPPLWWLRTQLRLDQEFLADRRAALGAGPPSSYASALLALAAPGAGAGPAGVGGRRARGCRARPWSSAC